MLTYPAKRPSSVHRRRPFFMNLILFKRLSLTVIAGLLTACSVAPVPPRVLWPAPPEEPKIEFLGTYSSKDDFPGTREITVAINPTPPAFSMPFGIVSDGLNRVFIADRSANNIKIFNFGSKTVTEFGQEGTFQGPLDLALDKEGRLYVVNGKTKKVLVFSSSFHPLFSFGDNSDLEAPSYIEINERLARIYVSEGRRNRISVFDKNGQFLFYFGQTGSGDGQLAIPQGIAIDREDRVYVADMLNARIQVFSADGNFLYRFDIVGLPDWNFENPKDLAIGVDGNIYVLEQRKALLLSYTLQGELRFIVGSKKGSSRHPLGLAAPGAIHIDEVGRIFISDVLNRRFSVWQELSGDYLRDHPVTKDDLARVTRFAHIEKEE